MTKVLTQVGQLKLSNKKLLDIFNVIATYSLRVIRRSYSRRREIAEIRINICMRVRSVILMRFISIRH